MSPLFASTALGARIDRAETHLTTSIGRTLVGQPEHSGAFVEKLAGGVAVYAGPHSPMNKMIGIGFEGLPDDERLRSIEERFKARHASLQAEVSTLVDGAFGAHLSRRGYIFQGFENILGRALSAEDRATLTLRNDGIDVRPMQAEEGEAWLDTDITAVLHPDEQGVHAEQLPPRELLERAMRPFMEVPGFRKYFARIDGEIAGVAVLRQDGGIAQLCGAATLPGFRRRGVQTKLLLQRLADAFEDGCELAVMTTQPGSKSQENAQRQGFALLYGRALLVKNPA